MQAELATPRVQDMAAYDAHKRRLIGGLHGRVLEIGAGTGANFGLLSDDVDWIGLEPDRGRRRKLAESRAGCIVLDANSRTHPAAGQQR